MRTNNIMSNIDVGYIGNSIDYIRIDRAVRFADNTWHDLITRVYFAKNPLDAQRLEKRLNQLYEVCEKMIPG